MMIAGSVDGGSPPAPARRGRALKLLLVVAAFVTLFAIVDVREVRDIMRKLPLGVVALAVVVLSLDRILMGIKWRHLVLGGGARMRLADAVSIYYQSKFTTLVFPAAFGGEVLRGVLGARTGVPGHLLVASMVLERVVAAVSSLILAGAGLAYLGSLGARAGRGGSVVLLVAIAGSALAAAAVFALHRPAHKLVGRAVRRWVPERLFRLLDRLSSAVVQYRSAPEVLVTNLGLTLVEHTLQIAALTVLAVGLGIQLPILQFLGATSIVMLVRRGAGFLEGWGLAESGVVMLYTIFGVPAARSAALAVALWAVSLIACLPGGYLLWRGAWRARVSSASAGQAS